MAPIPHELRGDVAAARYHDQLIHGWTPPE
jgi:hypothetical protein